MLFFGASIVQGLQFGRAVEGLIYSRSNPLRDYTLSTTQELFGAAEIAEAHGRLAQLVRAWC